MRHLPTQLLLTVVAVVVGIGIYAGVWLWHPFERFQQTYTVQSSVVSESELIVLDSEEIGSNSVEWWPGGDSPSPPISSADSDLIERGNRFRDIRCLSP